MLSENSCHSLCTRFMHFSEIVALYYKECTLKDNCYNLASWVCLSGQYSFNLRKHYFAFFICNYGLIWFPKSTLKTQVAKNNLSPKCNRHFNYIYYPFSIIRDFDTNWNISACTLFYFHKPLENSHYLKVTIKAF